ncbi:murein L,D-transpeptidase [Mucilaginibacter terrigena]|uniref:Murein L,D-transpeptidase n=1 Tax=Mucilaginibacter terrigena TaxID=2492395 RepID=A0A4Q5LKB1_9SPHI|nr:L,D-transpeptidase family protein [Mucilaginibacter terrigena]RYU90026.1 murein L,D-transpeptidase [Mucilaginibacter terrigena]
MPKLFFILLLMFAPVIKPIDLPDSKRASTARTAIWPKLQQELNDRGFDKKYRLYIRIIKQLDQLEVWAKKGNKYELFKRYNICYYSGDLGTKTRKGDGKSPEGFYSIGANQLNPVSNYHLSINIGYPNKLEKLKGYTGDAIMIHGRCASIGCYAMTNPSIEEIYTLVYKALETGQKDIGLAIFPFKLDNEHLKKFAGSPYYLFWKMMQPGYELFEKTHIPPLVGVNRQQYSFK